MVDSRIDDIENFAREIIEKVTLRAMDIVKASSEDADSSSLRFSPNRANSGRKCNETKNRNRSLRTSRQQINNERGKKNCFGDADEHSRGLVTNIPVDASESANEEIRKIVMGLQGVRIGDSTLVQPIKEISNLEQQVKRAVEEISGACVISDFIVPVIVEGQGDVHDKIFHETITDSVPEIDTMIDPAQVSTGEIPSITNKVEKQWDENESTRQAAPRIQPEVSKLRSTCFLHRIIRELENAETNEENVLCSSASSIRPIGQDRIAEWEENEEKFIRTIEGTKDETEIDENPVIIDDSFAICPINESPVECIVDVVIEELNSRPTSSPSTPPPFPPSPQPPPPSPPPLPPTIRETVVEHPKTKKRTTMPRENERTLEKTKTRNKKSVGERLRRFFRGAFKRGKDC